MIKSSDNREHVEQDNKKFEAYTRRRHGNHPLGQSGLAVEFFHYEGFYR